MAELRLKIGVATFAIGLAIYGCKKDTGLGAKVASDTPIGNFDAKDCNESIKGKSKTELLRLVELLRIYVLENGDAVALAMLDEALKAIETSDASDPRTAERLKAMLAERGIDIATLIDDKGNVNETKSKEVADAWVKAEKNTAVKARVNKVIQDMLGSPQSGLAEMIEQMKASAAKGEIANVDAKVMADIMIAAEGTHPEIAQALVDVVARNLYQLAELDRSEVVTLAMTSGNSTEMAAMRAGLPESIAKLAAANQSIESILNLTAKVAGNGGQAASTKADLAGQVADSLKGLAADPNATPEQVVKYCSAFDTIGFVNEAGNVYDSSISTEASAELARIKKGAAEAASGKPEFNQAEYRKLAKEYAETRATEVREKSYRLEAKVKL